ncbi:hypothetical protein [Streptomyces sp. NPDC046925]|uniref:hypothetical protein n=1 Tax=Streptomyces sp. NPDC046925 TaxID=3155375 RepID=UPI0033F108F0
MTPRQARSVPLCDVPTWGIRVYCKGCGDVQRNYGKWRHLYGDLVTPHFREIADDAVTGRTFTEPVTSVKCPGGTVDLEKDRAP